jgi:aminoglycoside 3-N-acetyltransferase
MMDVNIDIDAALNKVGVLSTDWVMLHADAGVAAQFRTIDMAKRLTHLQLQLVNFIADGTLVVPAFSYSFTRGESFDPDHTPSRVGQFSEEFRSLPNIKRTQHPIFSVCTIGVGADTIMNARLDDCFGPGTVFDLLNQKNAKLVCLGCDFSRITFVHYVEQLFGVSYRQPKFFSGTLIEKDKQTPLSSQYLVRDLALKSSCDLRLLKAEAVRRGVLKFDTVGRFPIMAISTGDFLSLALELLKKNEYALIEQGASKYDF